MEYKSPRTVVDGSGSILRRVPQERHKPTFDAMVGDRRQMHSTSVWEISGIIGVLVALASLGTVCLLRPAVIVRFLQRRYQDSALFRLTLFSKYVFKSWYTVVVRVWGVVFWVFVLITLFGVLTSP